MINNFFMWCRQVVPCVFDDSLSLYENMCKVVAKLNEVIDHYNGFENATKSYIDNRLANIINKWTLILNSALTTQDAWVKAQLEKNKDWLSREIAAMDQRVTNRISENQEWVSDRLALNEKHMDALRESVIKAIDEVNEYVAQQLSEINQLIVSGDTAQRAYTNQKFEEVIQMIPRITSVIVRSPVDHKLYPISEVLTQMWDILRYGAMTCGEYDSLCITCGEYDDKGLTCAMYDLYALKYLWPFFKDRFAYHPATGSRDNVQFVEYFLANFARVNGLTAAEYDALNLQAGDYDRKQLTAYAYDWDGVV